MTVYIIVNAFDHSQALGQRSLAAPCGFVPLAFASTYETRAQAEWIAKRVPFTVVKEQTDGY